MITVDARTAALSDAQTILHPTRYRILEAIYQASLSPNDRGLNAEQVAAALGLSMSPTVTFYIMDLSQAGFLQGTFYEIRRATAEKKGRAARFYRTTPKVIAAFSNIIRELNTTWGHEDGT